MAELTFLEVLYKNKFEIEEKLHAVINEEPNVSEDDEAWYYRQQKLQIHMFLGQKVLVDNLIAKYLELHK